MTTQKDSSFDVESKSKQSVQLGSPSQRSALRFTKDGLTPDQSQ